MQQTSRGQHSGEAAHFGIPTADPAAWAAHLTAAEWPVLPDSADFLAMAAQTEGLEDAHSLSDQVDKDPLLVIKVLAFGAALQTSAQREPSAQTPLECILLAGVVPFLSTFSQLAALPQELGAPPPGSNDHTPLDALLTRTRRAANITRAVAIARQDTQAAKLYTAAQLYAAPELLMATRHIALRKQDEPSASINDKQLQQDLERITYGCTLDEIRHALMAHLQLPLHLQQVLRAPEDPQPDARPQLIPLAHRIATLGPQGLSNPAADTPIHQMAMILAQPDKETRSQLQELCDD